MKAVDKILGEAMTSHEKRIHKDPQKAVLHARKKGRRFPEAEPYIATDPYWSYRYARDIIVGRWPEAEPAIVTDPEYIYLYAKNVLESRWPEAEPALAKDPFYAYDYARDVIDGRFPEAEEAIARSKDLKDDYLYHFPEAKEDWLLNGWLDWLDT
jgi:hypothetical protein